MKQIAMIVFFVGCIFTMYGQEDAVLDSVVSNIIKQLYVFPQEKIYLHTDKPYYITGEKIFFRAFLLDAFSNRQDTLSRYVYVELINPVDSVVQRVKIRKDSINLFYGVIPLSEELPQGNYKIRAYTQYMCNQGESSFFSKYVRISDPEILSIQPQTDFQFTEAGKINASLRFVNAKTLDAIQPQSVTLRLNNDLPFTGKPDKEGWIRVKLNVPNEATTRVLYVELTDNKRIFRQYIRIPYPEGEFDVSFYPEGGHLIAGQSSNVAFKAVDTNGTALNIQGEVTVSKGNKVAEFKTFYDGMGEFYINPQPDEHYQAACHNGDHTLKFDLPEVQKNTFSLKAIFQNNKLWVAVNKYDLVSYPELYLLIHSRGSVIYAKAWDTGKEFVTFDTSIFPPGISHILLLTKNLQIVSERLVFLMNDDNGITTFQTQKDTYRKREQVQAGIQLKDEAHQPLKGNFSIAVTDDKEVVTDSTTSILSDILLRSELRGQIDNPEYYFQKGNKAAETAADLLMKTQGWTRYAIPEVIKGELTYPKIPFEQSQEISGIVKSGLISKPAKDLKISLISLNYGFYDLTQSDKNGRYVFKNFEFPDSTHFVIQALNKKGKGRQMTELTIDEDTFPKINTAWENPVVQEENTNSIFMDYIAKADQQYINEHGMRIINLPEIKINGSYRYKKPTDYFSVDGYFSAKDIERLGIKSTLSLIMTHPRSMIGIPNVIIDNRPLFGILDHFGEYSDIPLQEYIEVMGGSNSEIAAHALEHFYYEKLNMINVNDIDQVFFYDSPGHSNPTTIVIYTNRWYGGHSMLPSIEYMLPLGYQLPVEFYSPKYDTQEKINDSKPDLRTTIYWKPNVITDDSGNAKVDFYTSDDPSTYSVIIEGISDEGKLIHYRGNASIVVK